MLTLVLSVAVAMGPNSILGSVRLVLLVGCRESTDTEIDVKLMGEFSELLLAFILDRTPEEPDSVQFTSLIESAGVVFDCAMVEFPNK